MRYSTKQRQQIIDQSKGKRVESLEWDAEGEYWVMEFTGGTEMSFRFMAEIVS